MIKITDQTGENNISTGQTENILGSSPNTAISDKKLISKPVNRLFLRTLRSPLAKYWLLDVEKGVVLFFWDDSYHHESKPLQNSETLLYGEFFLALNNFTKNAMSQSIHHIRMQRLSLYLIKEKSYLHVFALERNSPMFMNRLKESHVKSFLLSFSKELSVQWENINHVSSSNSLSPSDQIDQFVEEVLKIKEKLSKSFDS